MLTDFLMKKLREESLAELACNLDRGYTYHNAEHTLDVCLALDEFTAAIKMEPEKRFVLQYAALFHDFGYLEAAEQNESLALPYMQKYARQFGVSASVVEQAQALILETAFPYHPLTPEGELLCDADIEYIGRDCFMEKALLFRAELAGQGCIFSDLAWWNAELEFLKSNCFFTGICRQLRESGRQKNLEQVQHIITTLKG